MNRKINSSSSGLTRKESLSLKKKIIFTFVTGVLIFTFTEGLSFFLFRIPWTRHPQLKNGVLWLCGENLDQVTYLPNTFWHHDLNPNDANRIGTINRHGTKGEDFEVPKPDGEFRVICIGDSTVEGIRLKPEETFPYFLEEKLKETLKERRGYKTARVINAGVGSHNSAFNLAYLAFRLIHFEPDAVVIKSSYNDYLPYCVPGMQWDYTHAFPSPYHLGPSSNPYWFFARYSYTLKLLGYFLFQEEVVNPFKDFSGRSTQAEKLDFSSNASKFWIYGENIRSMILLCKGRGIQVFILDLPTPSDPKYYGRGRSSWKDFRKIIKRLEDKL